MNKPPMGKNVKKEEINYQAFVHGLKQVYISFWPELEKEPKELRLRVLAQLGSVALMVQEPGQLKLLALRSGYETICRALRGEEETNGDR